MTVSVSNEVTRPLSAPAVGLAAQVAVLVSLAAGGALGAVGWAVGGVYAVVTWALVSWGQHRAAGGGWGPADTVTLARAVLVGGVTALVADSLTGAAPVAVLVALATVALILDGVDGQVARRTGTASRFGARFDMETDCVLVLALAVYVASWLGWWVLAVGAFRYAFGVAAWAMPWLRAPLPPRLSRKAVAVLQGVTLLVVSAGVVPAAVAPGAIVGVLALLVWSFGRDTWALWRLRRGRAGQDAVNVTGVGPVRQRGQVIRHFFLGDPAAEGQVVALAQRHVEPVRAK